MFLKTTFKVVVFMVRRDKCGDDASLVLILDVRSET